MFATLLIAASREVVPMKVFVKQSFFIQLFIINWTSVVMELTILCPLNFKVPLNSEFFNFYRVAGLSKCHEPPIQDGSSLLIKM